MACALQHVCMQPAPARLGARLLDNLRWEARRGTLDPTVESKLGLEPGEIQKRILEADPETLTAEERKQLPFLRRRKIMQNPESPAAKSLQRAAAAYAAGELPAPPPLPAAEGDSLSRDPSAQLICCGIVPERAIRR